LRALAFTGPQRSRILPEVPAIAEFYPDFAMVQWLFLDVRRLSRRRFR